jgi:hypothetical protein
MRLVAILMSVAVLAAGEAEPAIVAEQLAQIRPAIERAKLEYQRKVRIENERLIKILETAQSRETRSGNLEQALAIKDAIEKAKKGVFVEGLMNPTYVDLLEAGVGPREALIEITPRVATDLLAEGRLLSPNKGYQFAEVPKEFAGLRYAQFNHREPVAYTIKALRPGRIMLAVHRNAPLAEFEKLGFERLATPLAVVWQAGNLAVLGRRLEAGEVITIPADEWVTPVPIWAPQ